MTRDQIEDRQASAAFDGPSTPEERLRYRIGGAAYDLHVLAQCEASPGELIAKAREVIDLAARLSRASFVLKN